MTVSLAQLAREFLDRPGLSQNTQQSYEFTLMPLLAEYGHFPVEVIGRQVLLDYLKAKEYLSLNTHRKHQAIINALFNYAVFAGYLAVNPIALLKRRKPNPNKGEHNTDQVVRYLSQSQLAILYDLVTPDARMHARSAIAASNRS